MNYCSVFCLDCQIISFLEFMSIDKNFELQSDCSVFGILSAKFSSFLLMKDILYILQSPWII